MAIAATALLAALGAPAAAVQTGLHDGRLVSDTSVAGWTPHVLDGYVEAIAEVGDTVVIGGNFSQIATAADRTTPIDRAYLFSFQKGSGAINTAFSPVVNGEITSILPTGDGQTVWIAGGFNNLNGQTVRNIAKVDLATGQRVTQFAPPALNGRVHDLHLRNGKLYLTGRFTLAGSQSRPLLAAVDPVTGALDPDVRADFTDPRSDGFLTVHSADISPDGTKMAVVGNFTKVNGLDRYQIAQLDLTTSPVSVADWQTDLYGDGCARVFDTYMRDVEYSPDGSYFVVVTTGAYNTTYLCDTAARWETGATGSDLQPTWVNYTGGDTLTAVAVTDTAVYLGGHQRWMNNPYARDAVGPGAVAREGLAAVDPRSGATLSWDPGRTRGYGVYTFVATDDGLWIGSDTDRIAGFQYRGRLAFMPLDPTREMPTEHVGDLPAQVVSLGLLQGGFGSSLDRTTTREFTGSSVTSSGTAAGTEDWSSVRGAFMVDGELYTAWSNGFFSNGSLRVQDYDGTTFGPLTEVPLALVEGNSTSTNRFASEDLRDLTGMFYDPATGRLYFTTSGSSSLHHRSFSPESRIVGAERISSAAGAGGVDWSDVQSMFLADGRLYTSSDSGELVSRAWDPAAGLPTGPASVVSGPDLDGEDWRARDTFVFAAADVEPPNQAPVPSFTTSCVGASCSFDASASADPDGAIVSYVWDFGDGTSTGAGVTPTHVYAASGTFDVTLTTTDDRGASSSITQSVSVVVPNLAPTAKIERTCSGLSCSFDGTASVDPDGEIVAHEWDLGDGSTSTQAVTPHTYTSPGTYSVRLTVTDDRGAVSTATEQVNVIDPDATPSVTFRAAGGSSSNSSSSSLVVPADVRPGDLMVLFASSNSGTATTTGPAGWTLLDSVADGTAGAQTAAWARTAQDGDPGSVLTVTTSSITKTALQLVAYDGAASVSAHAARIDTASTDLRTTPEVVVSTPGSTLVSYWADKSGDNDGWQLPAGTTLRDQQVGTGGGRIVAAVADDDQLGAGGAGGLVARSGSVNRRAMVWSVVLAPDTGGPPANVAPTAAFTTSCAGDTCTVDAAASTDSDGSILDYAWDFGDGATGAGVTASHVYPAPGTYQVTLTVTDDDGATASAFRQVSVADPGTDPVTFRAASSTNGNTTASVVVVPAEVQAGDVLVLITTAASTTTVLSGPDGWVPVAGAVDAATDTQSRLWTRTADAADAGSIAVVSSSGRAKISSQLVAYGGASGISAQALAFDPVVRNDRTTPVVPVAVPGSILVSYWADKSGTTTDWTLPTGVQLRDLSVGIGGGHITAAIGDTASVPVGPAGGLTALADSANRRGVTWSIVLAPAGTG